MPIIDPLVLDKAIEKYRPGSRKLADVARHHGGTAFADSSWHSAEADAIAAGRACKAPTLNISAQPGSNALADVEALIENCVTGKTVGAGHLHLLEIPDQVNAMIAQFIREYVD